MKTKVWLLLLAFIVIIIACEDEEGENLNEVIPDELIGNWEAIITDGAIESKNTLTFTEDAFTMLFLEKDNNEWHVDEGVKGTFTVSGNELTLTFTHFGFSDYDEVTQTYGDCIWYGSGTAEYDYMIEFCEGATFKAEYSVSGNQLTFKWDENRDGIYSADETTVYVKV
ncbi:hypothetical protein ACFLSE_08365 [Bacteroidota bacterium]